MTINSQQLAEAQNWIQNSGWGSYDPSGGFGLNSGGLSSSGDAATHILGAAQSMGYNSEDMSQILRGAYNPGQIDAFSSQNKPLIDVGQSVFEHDKGSAPAAPAPVQNLGFSGGGGGSSGGTNPYLSQMADDIGRRSNQALGQGLQSIRSNSVGVGGLGGSRQGVAEGMAIANSNDSLQGNLANLYGTDNNNMQNRELQRYGINTNAALTNQGQTQNFYTQNRQLDQSGMQLGANLFAQGNSGLTGQGQGVYNIGTTQQQAPWNVINNTSGNVSPYTGYGATNTGTSTSGGGASGMMGGALAGAQIGKNLGFGSSGGGNGFQQGSMGSGVSDNTGWYNQQIGM